MPKTRFRGPPPFEYDPDEYMDPLELRYVLDALDRVRQLNTKVDLTPVYEAIAQRDLFPKRTAPGAELSNSLLAMGVSVNRGELLKRDPETLEPICADALQELADECGKLAAGIGLPKPTENVDANEEG